MNDNQDPIDLIEPDVDVIDAMGRRAGADLRYSAPPNGANDVVRTARRRSTMRALSVGGAVALVALGVVVAVARSDDAEPSRPVETVPTPDSTPDSVVTAVPFDGTLGAVVFTDQQDAPDGRDVYTADADGSNVQLVQRAWDGFGISPDGTKMLGTRIFTDGRRLPYLVDVGGENGHFVEPSDPALNLGGLSWSPDGTHFVGEGYGDDLSKRGVWSMAVDGSDLRRLTDPGSSADVPAPDGAAYSPDGDRVMFFRSQDGDDLVHSQVMTVNVDGSDARAVSPSAYHTEPGKAQWSPDGSKLAFVVFDGDSTFFEEKSRAVFVADAAGGEPVKIAGWRDIYDVAWSPDGTMFALSVHAPRGNDGRAGNSQIHTMNADGSNLQQVVVPDDIQTFTVSPQWSPDGRKIMFFQSGANETPSIRVLDVDSGVIVRVLPGSALGYEAHWVQPAR